MTGPSDDGQAGVTEADRETAKSLTLSTGAEPYELAIEWIAAALAAEREKARAPFLQLALALEQRASMSRIVRRSLLRDAAAGIRRAVEEEAL